MAQTREGAIQIAAKKVGLSVEEYRAKLEAGQKWCTRCKGWHEVTRFSKDNSRWDGLKASCKESDYKRQRTDSPGKAERQAKKASGLSWCSGHREWLSSTVVDKNGKCRECANRDYRKYYHGKGGAAIKARTYKRRRGVEVVPDIGKEYLLMCFDGLCAYCQVNPATAYDHIISVKAGGRTEPGNMLPVCIFCNSSKSDTPLLKWAESKGLMISERVLDVIALMQEDDDRYG